MSRSLFGCLNVEKHAGQLIFLDIALVLKNLFCIMKFADLKKKISLDGMMLNKAEY